MSAPPPPGRVPPAQTLAERVLAHLKGHPIPPQAADVPPEVTQEGIADALGAQVAHVSRALKSLALRGMVAAHLAHPKGARRRSRAYWLTDAGREASRALALPAAPAKPPAAPRRAAPARAPAGRDAQMRDLLLALDEAARGGPRVALVEGDAGMGKTRLLDAFRVAAQQRGARVVVGTGAPTGAEQLVGPLGPALEPLGFERRFRAVAAGTPRERAMAAATDAIETAAKAEPVVVVLDDLHLAGPSVAEFAHGLALALQKGTRALLVVAFRREEAWALPNGPLYTALAPLREHEGARHVTLGPLDAAGVAALLADADARHVGGDILARIARESGGNPLYALAMARAMEDGVEEGDFFPAAVRVLATSRFAGLPGSALATLQASAVCGPELDYDLLARVQDVAHEPELLASLDTLLDRLLLEEVPAADALRLRFTHPKVREAVLGETSAARRRWLEARLAVAARQR